MRKNSINKLIMISLFAALTFVGCLIQIPLPSGGMVHLGNLVIIVSALLFTTILTIISTYAKSVKEATSLATPLMLVVSLVGMSGMMTGESSSSLALYLIPIYNSIQCFGSILSSAIDPFAIIITIGVNIGYISLGVFLLTKMFNSEKIMFNK